MMKSHGKNKKMEPFRLGQRVRRLFGEDHGPLVINWISKGSTCREDQLICADHPSYKNPCDASLFIEVRESKDIVEDLRATCVGKPAKIPWPHRLLIEAADEIERLQGERVRG